MGMCHMEFLEEVRSMLEQDSKIAERNCEDENVYRFMIELISRSENIQSMMNSVYKRYGFPLILSDISYHLIAYAGPMPCPDPYWNAILENGVAPQETIIDGYYKDGYMDRISVEKDPFDVNWGISVDYPQTTCAVRIGNMIEAISSVLYLDKEKLPLALAVNSGLRSAAEIYLKLNGFDKQYGTLEPERAIAARILLEDVNSPITLLTRSSLITDLRQNEGFVVIAVSAKNAAEGRLQGLRSSIKVRNKNMLYVNKDDGIYMLFSGINSEKKLRQLLADIQTDAEDKVDYVCGVSDIFFDIEKRGAYVEQAKLSLELGMSCANGGHEYLFTEYYAALMIRKGYTNVCRESHLLPEIRALIESDKENGTEFFNSLKYYLYNLGDMSKTAAQLYLHRNSCMYRIRRCQEIMKVDLSDAKTFERLYFCCRIKDIQDRYPG